MNDMNSKITVSRLWHAMGTAFEAFLGGADGEHLEAVLGALEDESRRLEGVLSRFDPASEISRINRDLRPVRLDIEVWGLLAACDEYRRRTDGYFDVTGGQGMELDPTARTVRRASPAARQSWMSGIPHDTRQVTRPGRGSTLPPRRRMPRPGRAHAADIPPM